MIIKELKSEIEGIDIYLLDQILKERYQQNDVILDTGCGSGRNLKRFYENKLTVYGVDSLESRIEEVKEKYTEQHSNFSLQNLDQLQFENHFFDHVICSTVLHFAQNIQQFKRMVAELFRVLKPGGFAKIMIYHKHSPVGWMLWIKYGLFKFRPFRSLENIYSDYLESPGTKAYTIEEAKELVKQFSNAEISVQLSFGDLLDGNVGVRHKGWVLSLAKAMYPKLLIKIIKLNFFLDCNTPC